MRIASWTIVFLLCLVVVSGGCQAQPQPRQAIFDPAEYRPYGEEGSGTILGQAFLKTRSGDVKYGAGEVVTLNPVTAYSTEWFNRTILQGVPLEPADPRSAEYNQQTTADGEGRFEFNGLPAGEYYLATEVRWEVATSKYTTSMQGGYVCAKVAVADGETVKIILTR